MTDRQKNVSQGNNQRRLDLLLRFTLAAVFLWAGATKIADPYKFANVISNYQLLPEIMVNAMAVWLPWIEVLCGVLLVCGVWIDGSLVIVNTLLIVFMAALISNWIRGIDVDCGCFSAVASEGESSTLFDIFRDAVFLGIGLRVFYARTRYRRYRNTATVWREN
jgi:uncharacterized membrane protein YphA (DoxX/SURF4 family)